LLFEVKLLSGTVLAVLLGLVLYFRGARARPYEGEEVEKGRMGG
jgi:hypothetical protein